jgi:hypothetical protein
MPADSLAYNGYTRKQTDEPNMFLCGVGRGTPGGAWHRVALFEKTIPFSERVNGLCIEGLSKADLAVLRRALATIYDNVQRQYE